MVFKGVIVIGGVTRLLVADLTDPFKGEKSITALFVWVWRVVCEQGMHEDNVRPNEKFYAALLRATGEGGRADRTILILQEMRKMGLKPGVRTYNTAVGACGKVMVLYKKHTLRNRSTLLQF